MKLRDWPKFTKLKLAPNAKPMIERADNQSALPSAFKKSAIRKAANVKEPMVAAKGDDDLMSQKQ
jgi:hypothetical protein